MQIGWTRLGDMQITGNRQMKKTCVWRCSAITQPTFNQSIFCTRAKQDNACLGHSHNTRRHIYSGPATANGPVCMCLRVCLSVCLAIIFERHDLFPRYSACWFILTISRTYSKVKVINQKMTITGGQMLLKLSVRP